MITNNTIKCKLLLSGGIFYAQKLISGNRVYCYDGVCYGVRHNIALNIGGMTNEVFLLAFKELVIMGPIAFVLDIFLVGRIAKYKTFKIINPERDNPFFIVLGISVISVIFMCPLMSLAATLLFKNAGSEVIAVWIQTTITNFPMALCWQLFFAGPVVRAVFSLIFREKKTLQKDEMKEMPEIEVQ